MFNARKMPSWQQYAEERGIKLTGHGPWRSILCPFHNDTTPSLRLNLSGQYWKCMSCNEAGKDVLAFHRTLHPHLTFRAACIELGCWEPR